MSEQKNKYYKLAYVFLFVDAAVLLCYLVMPETVLMTLLKTFDELSPQHSSNKYRFLVWGAVLFFVCAGCSYFRQSYLATPPASSKSIVFFELMVLSAVALMTWRAITHTENIDPTWIIRLSFWSYVFEIVTTAGAGYVLADFLFRFRFIFKG